jgi:hypothetical protein
MHHARTLVRTQGLVAGIVLQSNTEHRPKGTFMVTKSLHFQLREGMNNLLISHALLAR